MKLSPTTLYSVSYCDLSFLPNGVTGAVGGGSYCFLRVVPVGQISLQSLVISFNLLLLFWHISWIPIYVPQNLYTHQYTLTPNCHVKVSDSLFQLSACLMVKSQLIHGTANVNVYMAPSAQLFLPLGQCWGRCLQILSDQSSNGRVNCFPKKKSG